MAKSSRRWVGRSWSSAAAACWMPRGAGAMGTSCLQTSPASDGRWCGGPYRLGTGDVTSGEEARYDTVDIGLGSVLAELGLGLDPGDQQLDTDDRPQLPLDVRCRCVVDRPRLRFAFLVMGGESADERLEPAHVVVHHELPVHVSRHVVPRRDHPVV